MGPFLVCSNPKCLFLLDRRTNGKSLDGAEKILTKCPSCGRSWSSTCPSCGQTLAVKNLAEQPRRVCCTAKQHTSAEIAQSPAVVAAQAGA